MLNFLALLKSKFWRSENFVCPDCGRRTFIIHIERRFNPTKENVWSGELLTRLVVECTRCYRKFTVKQIIKGVGKTEKKNKASNTVVTGGVCKVCQ